MKTKIAPLMAFFGFFGTIFGAAPQYVDIKPMGQIVSMAVGEVKSGTVQLPVITWGGDIVTLLANGGEVTTKPGSLFAAQNLSFKIIRKDVFAEQVNDFVSGKSPYLRGTVGMINQSLSALKDPRVKPVVIYQMSWSSGGDVLVVRPSVKDASDLNGKTIVVQAYGPHVDFMVQTLKDAGVDPKQVKIKYVKDITGTDNSPAEAFRSDPTVDAVFCISPDAVDLTGGAGKTGTGAEKTVKGARYLMSTKTADKVIADVYAVRQDYLQTHTAEVESFVNALMNAEERLSDLSKNSSTKTEYDKLMSSAALVFLDSAESIDSAKGLLADCALIGYQGNVKFFSDPTYVRGFGKVSSENQASLAVLGLLSGKTTIASGGFDYEKIKTGLRNTAVEAESSRFDASAVASLLAQRGDALGTVFSFDVQFAPNMADFDVSQYKEQFDRVIDMASTYSGAVLVVEGHTDPNEYLKVLREKGVDNIATKQKKQANVNTSLRRANTVRDELLQYIAGKGLMLDESQVTTIGSGCSKPKQGIEKAGSFKGEPLPSTTEDMWRKNMRVTFSIKNVEAESDIFVPVQ